MGFVEICEAGFANWQIGHMLDRQCVTDCQWRLPSQFTVPLYILVVDVESIVKVNSQILEDP